jgi:hypothetical protein
MSDDPGTCGRGPLGTATNRPVPDAGTLARTQNRPPVPQGKQAISVPTVDSGSPAGGTGPEKKQSHPVSLYDEGESSIFDKLQGEIASLGIRYKIGVPTDLKNKLDAYYDPVNNEIRITREGYNKYRKGEREQLRISIVHELVHARQYKELLGRENDPNRRKQLIEKEVLSQKEEEYVKAMWGRELEAETIAQQVSIESLNAYEKAHGRSFSTNEVQTVLDAKLQNFTDETKASYESDSRAVYRELAGKAR